MVPPVYPKDQFDKQRQSEIRATAEVTEHGTLVNLRHVSPADASEDFKLATQLPLTLWRFDPAVGAAGSCPLRTTADFTMRFELR